MATCEVCETRTQFGRHIRHQASGRWELKAPKKPRRWSVNVQRKRVMLAGPLEAAALKAPNGRYRRVNICTRCIRTLDKHG